jgi:uroporphyrin-III C-methyltransferase
LTVALVGAGPGDPGLITVRGLELLRSCDAVVYDRLVARELVDEVPGEAIRLSRELLDQDEINDLLVDLGRQGLAVVRLKGGDPFVFGRGGEEALALAEAGVPFEIVPGISSLAAVPAAAGIPVTHRGLSQTVTLSTAHGEDGGEPDYDTLARTGGTLVLFMGLGRLAELAIGLIDAGLDPDVPAAVISRGTLPGQKVAIAPLCEIAEAAAGLRSPALLVVGEVVQLVDALAASRPLLTAATR